MIRYFVNHPTAANLLMVGFLIVGLINLPSLQLETFPQISIKEVEIRVVYPGATPLDVERAICRRIEDGLSGLENLNEQRCEARENMGLATAEMVEGGDIDQFMTDVQNEIDAITDFPDTAEDAVVEQRGRMSVVASLVITGLEDQTDLKLYAEQLKDQMLRYGGIPQVDVEGFSDRQFRIEIQDKAARELGLTLDDVANAITRQNVDLPAGEITSENGATILRFSDERRALDAYRSVIVASSDLGGQITLGEIARITDQFEDEEVEIQLDGDLAAVLDISKARADDTMRVMNQVNSFLEEERQRAPPGVTLTIIGDTSVALQDRLSMLTANSLQGILLVVAAMWLFFGYRQAFWIGMGLPVSFLGALALMAVSGLSINMLSMVGLLIVIGILMDDAIVIAENIAAKREQGLAPMDAAVAGTLQVMPGVISSFLTTVCVFGSLAFISGDLGELLRVIPIVMIMVLAVSLVEAFLILPNHLGHSANADKPGLITRKVEGGVAWTRDHIIGPVADFAVHYRYLTLGLAVMLFLASVSLLAGGAVKFQAFPEIDDNQLEARIELAASARLEDTRKIVEEVSLALDRVNAALSPDNVDGQPLVESVLVRFNENRDAGTNGAHLATIAVDVIETDQRTATNEQILAAWTAEVPDTLDVRQITLTEPSAGPAGRAVEIRLQHPDITVLEQASEDLRRWLAAYAGVYNLADDLSLGKPELAISLMDGAGALGVDARMIADQLRAAFYGVTADEIQIGSESFEIDVRLASTNRDSIGDLDSFTIETPAGERVPLNTIAEITPERGYTRLNRIDRLPSVSPTTSVAFAMFV
ncbi:MAG: efflux RND transporter permease subunit [Pseudomonadota bacterium]